MLDGAAGDWLAATQRPASFDSEAELHIQSSRSLPLDSDLPSAVLKESSDAQDATQTTDLRSTSAESHPDSADAESHPDSGDTESAAHHKTSWFSHWAHVKLQQLVSQLTAKPESVEPSLNEAPETSSSDLEQPAESEHLSCAQADAEQPQDDQSAQRADADLAQHADAKLAQHANAESAQTGDATSSRNNGARQDSEHNAESRLLRTILSGTHFFVLTAASLLAAWLVSSLLLGWLPTPLRRPRAPEAALLEEEEEWESPEAAHAGSGDAEEEEPQTSEQGTSLVTRARSVARSISEAVSGMVTNRSEEHEEEAGMEAESAPGISGVGSSRRARKPRGRRELAALGECSSLLPLMFVKSPCMCSCSVLIAEVTCLMRLSV